MVKLSDAEHAVLDCCRDGEAGSRPQIARPTGLSDPGAAVKRLLEADMLEARSIKIPNSWERRFMITEAGRALLLP